MKKSISAIIGASTLALSVGSFAETGYAGGSIAFMEYSEDGISDDASLTALVGRLGTDFNENISGEIRLGIGVGDDTVNVLGTDVDVELDSMFGVYLRGGVPVSEVFFPYAVLGFTRGEVTASAPGFSSTESESDVSFGIGADFNVSEAVAINVEYMSYYDKDGAEIGGFSLGLVTNF